MRTSTHPNRGSDLWWHPAPRDPNWTPRGTAIAIYTYTDRCCNVLFEVCRTADKEFPVRVPDPSVTHGYRWKLDGVQPVPFRLPQVLAAAQSGQDIVIVEGEKDVLILEARGVVATTNPFGALKWRQEYAQSLKGASKVIVIADWDGDAAKSRYKGQKHAIMVYRSLQQVGIAAEVVRAKEGKDASDHFAKGHGLEDFISVAIDELETLVGSPESDGDQSKKSLPEIRLNNVHFHDVVEEAWKAVNSANQPEFLFRRRNHLVRIDRHSRPARIEVVTPVVIFGVLFRVARWYRTSQEGKRWCKPDKDIARDIMENPYEHLPTLDSIVTCPLLGSGGDLITTPGYYVDEGLVFEAYDAVVIDDLPKKPTPENVDRAVAFLLDDLLGDFPFVTESDRAHAVAALVLPFARRLIPGCTPLHSIEAPSPGTGKGLLSNIIATICSGRPIQTRTLPRSQEEIRKMITAELTRSPQIVLLDNAPTTKPIDSAELAAALTAEEWTDRILGQTRMITVPNKALWLLTGNNPRFSMELARRSIRIRLDPKLDRPWLRKGFRHEDLVGWARENRTALVRAVLVLVQNWIASGCPAAEAKLGSFERWAEVIGGILECAGIAGFLGNLELLYELADAEGEMWREFAEAWFAGFRKRAMAAGELRDFCERGDLLGEVLGNGSPRSQSTRLGNALKMKRDAVVGRFRIERALDGKQGRRAYRVVPSDEEPDNLVANLEGQGCTSQITEEETITDSLATSTTFDEGWQDFSPDADEGDDGEKNDQGSKKVPQGSPESVKDDSQVSYGRQPCSPKVHPRLPKVHQCRGGGGDDEDWGEVP